MPTTKKAVFGLKNILNLLFVITIFITSCCFFTSSGRGCVLVVYSLRWWRLLVALVLPAIVTAVHYAVNKNLIFIADSTAVIMVMYSLSTFIFYKPLFQIGDHTQFHMAYGIVTFMSVLCVMTVITLVRHRANRFNNHFDVAINSFLTGMSFVLAVLFWQIFFLNRTNNTYSPINLVLFNGEIKQLFKNFTECGPMHLAGNVLFFTVVSVTASELAKRNVKLWGIAFPTLLSFSMELFQFVFNYGDTDIDDFVLNTIGAVIGYTIYKYIIQRIKEREEYDRNYWGYGC